VNVTGGTAPYTYRWSNGQSGSSLQNLTKGNYNLVLEDAKGCQTTYAARIPDCSGSSDACYSGLSILTPNNDGANDKFTITCTNDRSGRLAVYDRYGKQVYSQPGYDNSWTGVDSNGNTLPAGPYMWVLVVDFPSGRETFTGTVSILRN
jgi:gliding motility-associated-like protein